MFDLGDWIDQSHGGPLGRAQNETETGPIAGISQFIPILLLGKLQIGGGS